MKVRLAFFSVTQGLNTEADSETEDDDSYTTLTASTFPTVYGVLIQELVTNFSSIVDVLGTL